MASLPDDLRHALDSAVSGVPVQELALSVQRLIDAYRTPATPILRSDSDVVAYAACRMPAAYAAVRKALGYVAEAAPAFRPATQLDLGAGTGAAVWAAAATWPSLATVTAVDQEPEMVTLGRRHPQQGKGLVRLRLCAASGLESAIVSKRQAGLYRAARDLQWGDRWPPPPST